ncbi:Permease [Acidisarcina polymorpha]|uniref:Permease n=1 Tax=Acidisarcina polymorpha TaxID=2211140 RepID=A0A2Z5G571_9BACT|nr:ABC transporter permease [Acidisarcina polymorpha]AXC14221.1 Permease [Acidisarcina polymorpha]
MLQDLNYALRQLRRSPGFTLTALLTLALGTGVTAAVFSVIYAVMIQPLPYDHPERIIVPQTYSPQGYEQTASYPEYLDWRKQSHSFSALAAFRPYRRINLDGPSGPVSLSLTQGSDNLFDVFGVAPILGRTFLSGEDQPGKNDIVVLSYEVWQQNFGGASDVVGRVVRLDGLPYTVVGVMPAGFRYPISQRDAVYTPLHMIDLLRTSRGDHWLATVGRLKPGVSVAKAKADMDSVLANVERAFPDQGKGRRMEMRSIAEATIGSTRGPLQILLFAVLAVLAIASVNLAGLLLARGVKREREVALRAAIGASRSRLVRQMLTESLLLALIGVSVGAALAVGLLRAVRVLLIAALSRGADIHLNLPVMLATVGIAVLTSFLAGSIPALRLAAIAPGLSLKTGGSVGAGRGQHRLRASFIVIQVALAMILMVTAGLLLRLLSGLSNGDLGFETRGILAIDINLPQGTYKDRDPRTAFYDPLLEKVRAIPGVQSAGMIQLLPIESYGWNSDITIKGQPPPPASEERLAEDRYVDPGYFQTMGIKLLRGRMIDPKIDTPKSQQVAVVNEAFVKKFFSPAEDPIGKQFNDEGTTIIGVVSSVRQDIYQPAMAEIEYPASEIPEADARNLLASMHLVVRSSLPAETLASSLRGAFHDVDPSVPFLQPETMHEVIADVLTMERLENWLFGSFAAFALLLAAVGIYGLIAHEVELSTRDIGVRMALGASRMRVLTMIYKQVGWMLAGGIVAGLAGTLAARKLIAAVVAMHAGSDAPIIAWLVAGVFAAGILAAWFPARRAAGVEPMTALRSE